MQEIITMRHQTKPDEAINRHIERYYEHEGSYYMLDKTMDGVPPFYTFYALAHNPLDGVIDFPTKINVDGQEYWGDGLSWDKAIEKITPIILNDGK